MYDTLADVYDWLVPEGLLEPERSAAAFEMVLAELAGGARVLDCACGTGTLAVGLALRGFEVTASDASEGMVARTRALAAEHGARLATAVRRWEELDGGPFDAVFCVGNSITHADDRRTALAGMRGVLRDGGSRSRRPSRTTAPPTPSACATGRSPTSSCRRTSSPAATSRSRARSASTPRAIW
ncbi:MAG: class I SAM-dependent methyltransferase [Gemmatirosa sp.]